MFHDPPERTWQATNGPGPAEGSISLPCSGNSSQIGQINFQFNCTVEKLTVCFKTH